VEDITEIILVRFRWLTV